MQIYLVGGAVRDKLLNYPIKDKDYLVTGATIEDMLAAGYQQVGKSFPVFLHPKSQQEYALARTEKKQGTGYTGFSCDFSPSITVEQDLLRRDLTINAMAEDQNGNIIDPFNGQRDIEQKLLRHVSDAFIEDPLRVLRVAKFAARYYHLGFSVAKETMELMSQIVASGEIDALIPERIWQETQAALLGRDPDIYFEVLRECGALKVLMPELDCLWGVPNPAKWHPEIDTGVHTMMVLKQACLLSDKLTVRFASLCHDLGKGLTPQDQWPHHYGHEKLGLKPIKQLCERLRVPNDCKELALLNSEFHTHVHKAFELRADTTIKLFDRLDAWRKEDRFYDFLTCCIADMRGRTGFEEAEYPQAQLLKTLYQHAASINTKDIVAQGYKGQEIRTRLTELRIAAVKEKKASQN